MRVVATVGKREACVEIDTDPVRTPEIAAQGAFLAVGFVFVGFVADALLNVATSGAPGGIVVAAAAVLVAVLVLQIRVIGSPHPTPGLVWRRWGLLALVVLVVGPMLVVGPAWFGLLGFVAGSSVLVLPRPWGWVMYVLTCIAGGVLMSGVTHDALRICYVVVVTAATGLTVYGLSVLRDLVARLAAARSELARLSVAQERLRFVEDLRSLVDDRISRIVVRIELVLWLGARHAARTTDELTAIVATARAALREVRQVASSYRDQTLEHALGALRSVLGSAGLDVTVRCPGGEPPAPARGVLVAALHAVAEELLGLPDARRCEVVVRRDPACVRLDIVHDGGPVARGPALESLDDRVRGGGGDLGVEDGPGGTRRVQIRLPLEPARTRRLDRWPMPRSMEPRVALSILVAVVAGLYVNAVLFVLDGGRGVGVTALAIACITGVLLLQLAVFSRTSEVVGTRVRWALLLLQAALVALPVLAMADPLVGLPGLLAASLLLAVRGRVGALLFACVVVAVAAAQAAYGGGIAGIGYGVLATLDHGLVVYGLSRLGSLVVTLDATRRKLADAAVTDERLRFARDLHDLLGYSLSAIALKAEVATRLVDTGPPERLARETWEVAAVARQALTDVRSVSSRYRQLAIDEEMASVRSVLAAADIELTLHRDEHDIPAGAATVVATVLREGVCNVLRHSTAVRCDIAIRRSEGGVRVEIVNDGVPATRPGGPTTGSGIANLTARVTDLSGSLSASIGDGTHQLVATIPV